MLSEVSDCWSPIRLDFKVMIHQGKISKVAYMTVYRSNTVLARHNVQASMRLVLIRVAIGCQLAFALAVIRLSSPTRFANRAA
jgi:hypothetical protein